MGSPEPASRIIFRAILITVGVVITLWLIWQLRKPISWIVVATFIAVALSGPVAWLERYMRRGFAIALCYLGLILTPVLLGLIVVPPIVREASDLARTRRGTSPTPATTSRRTIASASSRRTTSCSRSSRRRRRSCPRRSPTPPRRWATSA
jgi:predicted PurR-regulated permease PerM